MNFPVIFPWQWGKYEREGSRYVLFTFQRYFNFEMKWTPLFWGKYVCWLFPFISTTFLHPGRKIKIAKLIVIVWKLEFRLKHGNTNKRGNMSSKCVVSIERSKSRKTENIENVYKFRKHSTMEFHKAFSQILFAILQSLILVEGPRITQK